MDLKLIKYNIGMKKVQLKERKKFKKARSYLEPKKQSLLIQKEGLEMIDEQPEPVRVEEIYIEDLSQTSELRRTAAQ